MKIRLTILLIILMILFTPKYLMGEVLGNSECTVNIEENPIYIEDNVNLKNIIRFDNIINIRKNMITKLVVNNLTFNNTNRRKIAVTYVPTNADCKKLTYKSTNRSVAKVNNKGIVTPVSNGTCQIICTTTDGSNISKKCKVKVAFKVKKIKLNKTKLNFTNKNKKTLTATVTPSNAANKKVKWTSSNTKVAKVNSKGIVTPVSNGTCIITCASSDGSNVKKTCTVNVNINVIKIKKIRLGDDELLFTDKSPQTLTPIISPVRANNQTFSWSSSNTEVALVSNTGVVTPVGYGTCTIRCKAEDGSNVIGVRQVRVDYSVRKVELDKKQLTFKNTKLQQIKATVTPHYTQNKIIWSSDNPQIAKVDQNGIVEPISNGKCKITCTTTDGTNISKTCDVTVNFKNTEISKVTGVILDKKDVNIHLNKSSKSVKLNATVFPLNVNDKSVIWSSSDTSVATVTDGIVTGVNPGKAIITVTTVDGNKKASATVTVNKNVIIIIGASQVQRMAVFKVNNYSSSNYNYSIEDGTLVRVYKYYTGHDYQTGILFPKANNEHIQKYKDVKKYTKIYVYFLMAGNTIGEYSSAEISSSNKGIKEDAQNYFNCIKKVKDEGYNVKGYVVSAHPVTPNHEKATNNKVVYDISDDAVKPKYRSNWKYYKYNKAMNKIIYKNYSSYDYIEYVPLFTKIMKVSNNRKNNFSFKIPYATIDGVHWDSATAAKYFKMMLDYTNEL